MADKVVERAEEYCSRIRAEWLGGHLPATRTPTSIYVEIDPKRSFARTVIDPLGKRHMVWLVGSEEAVTDYLLHHELVHVVLGAEFGESLPVWGNEGIASRYDNQRRHDLRQTQLAQFVATDSWPDLKTLFESPVRQRWQYASAVSVSDYLIAQGGAEKFVRFLNDSSTDPAHSLNEYYAIQSFSELQTSWQQHVRESLDEKRSSEAVATLPTSASRYAR
ncbi:gluzincin family metallopeptidase [Aeoliella mucimassa]|uniref:hypothetical protein n=1 Tax=Aeoliella mucimassa TaxID=2527972 RepID=UPI0018D479ED|nr:hypothetical protein [Aeoliella mucimassa]